MNIDLHKLSENIYSTLFVVITDLCCAFLFLYLYFPEHIEKLDNYRLTLLCISIAIPVLFFHLMMAQSFFPNRSLVANVETAGIYTIFTFIAPSLLYSFHYPIFTILAVAKGTIAISILSMYLTRLWAKKYLKKMNESKVKNSKADLNSENINGVSQISNPKEKIPQQ